jgi:hypothetical protein
MPRKWFPLFLAVSSLVATSSLAHAWNYAEHRVIASIAYRQFDEPTKHRIVQVLRKHPAYAELWANRPTNGPDEVLKLL